MAEIIEITGYLKKHRWSNKEDGLLVSRYIRAAKLVKLSAKLGQELLKHESFEKGVAEQARWPAYAYMRFAEATIALSMEIGTALMAEDSVALDQAFNIFLLEAMQRDLKQLYGELPGKFATYKPAVPHFDEG